MKKTGRPGVMLYYDKICPALSRLDDSQLGALLRGIIEYSQTGALPELDSMAGLVFEMLRPGLERDADAYESKVIHANYMTYCRITKEKGKNPVSEEMYREQLLVTGSNNAVTNSDSTLPTPTVNPSPNPSPTPYIDPSPAPEGAAAGGGEAEGFKGDERGDQRRRVKEFEDYRRRRAEAAKGGR